MSKMWRNISTRLFRQYVQAGIQTSGAGCQDEDGKRSIPCFILPQYSLKENGTAPEQSVRLFSSAPPTKTEDGDDWEKNERRQNFRCRNFWGNCWNYGNIAEAMGLGSAIVLGLQLSRALNNNDREEQMGHGRLCRLAHAMPLTHNIRKSILPATKSTLSTSVKKTVQEEEQPKVDKEGPFEEESIESVEKVALDSLWETYNSLGLGFAKAGQFNEAVPYFHDGAKAGNCKAQYNIAVCYEHGRGVDTNDRKAAYWYKRASVQGHAMAQYNYGIFHLLGLGVKKKDEKEAVYWLNKSANQGVVQAQSYLGSMLMMQGPNKDLDKGIYFLQQAAKQMDVEATYRLGMCYEEGTGVPTNQAKAADLYNKAAMKGHSRAQCCMGRFHRLGLGGIPANTTEAKAWFRLASEKGSQEAKETLAALICLESEEHLLGGVDKASGVSVMHCSHSAPNLLGGLNIDDNLFGHLSSGDAPIWRDWPSVSYLDLLPTFHKHSHTFSRQSGNCSFQVGSEDDVHTLNDIRSEVKTRLNVAH